MTPIEHSRRLRVILSVNCGSSSLKYAIYPVLSDGVGEALHTATIEGALSAAPQPSGDAFGRALRVLDQVIHELGPVDILAVAHRIVHGGERFTGPVRVYAAVMSALAQLSGLAPLHQPHNLDGVRRFEAHWPGVPQIGCFDTAFHTTLPEVEFRFALSESLYQQGIRRFGFHGLSYEFVMGRLQALTPRSQGRVLTFHLGNGARVERINWAADLSERGLRQSCGMMVNYLYDLKRLDRQRAMLASGTVPMSRGIASSHF